MTETDLGKIVVQYLLSLDWEVYQEVSAGPGGSKRADIVATKGGLVWIVELKKTFGFSVLGQADEWIRYRQAHMVSVATPFPRRRGGDEAFRVRMAEFVGCGWLLVREVERWGNPNVEVKATPRIIRRLPRKRTIARFLRDDHKTGIAAGSPGGGYWTPFRGTMKAVAQEVARHPGIGLKELIERVDHHYSSDRSARQSIALWIREGRCENVEARKEGRMLRFYPKQQKKCTPAVADADK